MKAQDFIDKEKENLPAVRIKKVIIHNFKSVGYGEITFNCGRQFVPRHVESDILGIYGQNGSGKTSFIEALSILKYSMEGRSIPSAYTDCIAEGEECSELEFVFDMQYPDDKTIREAYYSFCISKRELTEDEEAEKKSNNNKSTDIDNYGTSYDEYKIVLFNEKFALSWEKSSKRQVIIDTSSELVPFIPNTKRKEMAGTKQDVSIKLAVNKQMACQNSRSFIFMPGTLEIFLTTNEDSIFNQVLAELNWYAKYYICVVDTKQSGIINLNLDIPVYTQNRNVIRINVQKPQILNNQQEKLLETIINKISFVLKELVPGLSLSVKEIAPTTDKKGEDAKAVMVMATRDGKEFPLRDESDGVRRIISVLDLIIAVFNEPSLTVAIDEFDSGVYEYLLGELLQILQEYGKGQFIFTSHNLRPLEVIDKKFLYFTTTNPQNRYIRLKNIGQTNNLRDTYYREIVMNEQEEEVYNRTKKHKIITALKKAEGTI